MLTRKEINAQERRDAADAIVAKLRAAKNSNPAVVAAAEKAIDTYSRRSPIDAITAAIAPLFPARADTREIRQIVEKIAVEAHVSGVASVNPEPEGSR